jgi:hypothetical protein
VGSRRGCRLGEARSDCGGGAELTDGTCLGPVGRVSVGDKLGAQVAEMVLDLAK